MRNKDWHHSDEMDMRLKALEKADKEYMDEVRDRKKPNHKMKYRQAM